MKRPNACDRCDVNARHLVNLPGVGPRGLCDEHLDVLYPPERDQRDDTDWLEDP